MTKQIQVDVQQGLKFPNGGIFFRIIGRRYPKRLIFRVLYKIAKGRLFSFFPNPGNSFRMAIEKRVEPDGSRRSL